MFGILSRLKRALRSQATTDENSSSPAAQMFIERKKFILTELIKKQIPSEKFKILDGGAREALDDPRWQSIGLENISMFGFEVDETECAKLNQMAKDEGLDFHYFPIGLWSDKTRKELEENASPGGCSFYFQNTDVTNRWKFQNANECFMAKDMFYPNGISEWDLTSIDLWASENNISDLDFLKLNVQGAELDILEGSTKLLPNVLGLLVEVSFVNSYKDRPLFGDVNKFIQENGFDFFDFQGLHYIGRSSSPITALHSPALYPQHGQLIESHAVYLKDPIQNGDLKSLTLSKLLKLVSFAEIFAQTEYAFELLAAYQKEMRLLENHKNAEITQKIFDEGLEQYKLYLNAGTNN